MTVSQALFKIFSSTRKRYIGDTWHKPWAVWGRSADPHGTISGQESWITDIHHKLFEFLLSRQTGVCGTVRRRRKNMPVITPLAARGNVVHKQAKNILAVVWKDKREVSLLYHSQSLSGWERELTLIRQPIMKSECVTDYNINMRLMDNSDAMIFSTDCARKTLKWYKKFFSPSS